jgi:hypothetical protein
LVKWRIVNLEVLPARFIRFFASEALKAQPSSRSGQETNQPFNSTFGVQFQHINLEAVCLSGVKVDGLAFCITYFNLAFFIDTFLCSPKEKYPKETAPCVPLLPALLEIFFAGQRK